MYAAKAAGRNRLHIYERSLDFKRDENRAIARSLREHIDSGSLTVVYQPIVDLGTGKVDGFEAYMRWQQSDGAIVAPSEFLPIADKTGVKLFFDLL